MAVDDRYAAVDKPIVILDFRDHDPSGIQMTEDLQTRFDRYSDGEEIEVKRVALTIEQVRKYTLVPNPTKRVDSRSPRYVAEFGDQCWELDAILPDELQRLVTATIEQHIDKERWKADLEREAAERKELRWRFENAKITIPENDAEGTQP
jgi:hypothetical protein